MAVISQEQSWKIHLPPLSYVFPLWKDSGLSTRTNQDKIRTRRRQLEISWAISGMHLLSTVYELGSGLQRGELRVTVDLWGSLLCSPRPPAFPGPGRPVHAARLHRLRSFCDWGQEQVTHHNKSQLKTIQSNQHTNKTPQRRNKKNLTSMFFHLLSFGSKYFRQGVT